ncbi:MAG TPA: hypothetical protein VFC51_08035 [Chloroflexota bacterium]|nr:hypothetical protein [Chloroflexota bacterium]
MSLSHRGVGSQSFDRTIREPRDALIRTAGGLVIRGNIYLVPGTRLTDLLERDTEVFVAVTSAAITSADGRTDRTPFVAVNKNHIVTMEEMVRTEAPPAPPAPEAAEAAQPARTA